MDLFVEIQYRRADAVRFVAIQHGFAAGRAELAGHRRNDCRTPFVGIPQDAGIVHQFCRSARWTYHGHASLKDTMSTSSTTVSFR